MVTKHSTFTIGTFPIRGTTTGAESMPHPPGGQRRAGSVRSQRWDVRRSSSSAARGPGDPALATFNGDESGVTFRVEIRVKNGPLYRAIKGAYPSVARFCKAHGLNQVLVGEFLNLKRCPVNRYGEWLPVVQRIADALGELPDDLFPEHLQIRLERNKAATELNREQLLEVMEASDPFAVLQRNDMSRVVHGVLGDLMPREAEVLRMRFGIGVQKDEMTLDECAEAFGVTRERIRQIESKALRKLRHPKSTGMLAEFLDDPNVGDRIRDEVRRADERRERQSDDA